MNENNYTMQTFSNLKEASIEVLKNMPKAATLEEIMYQINLTAKVFNGLKDEQEGKLVSSKELIDNMSFLKCQKLTTN